MLLRSASQVHEEGGRRSRKGWNRMAQMEPGGAGSERWQVRAGGILGISQFGHQIAPVGGFNLGTTDILDHIILDPNNILGAVLCKIFRSIPGP